MIKSYWLRILLCGFTAAIAGFLIAVITPKQYDAQLQVLVAPYFPNGMGTQNEADESVKDILDASAPRTVNTQVGMLISSGVLQTAVEKVGADMNLPYSHSGDLLNPYELRDKISIVAERDDDVIGLRVRMPDRDLAVRVATEMYNAFEDLNKRQAQESANRAIAFLTTQNNDIQGKLTAIEDAARKAQQAHNAPDLKTQIQSDISQLKEVEVQLETAKADQVGAEVRATEIAKQLEGVPKFVPGAKGTTENPLYERLDASLADAEQARSQALEKYLPDNEIVKGFDRVIADTKAKLAATKKFIETSTTTQPNPMWEAFEQDRKSSIALARAAASRAASLQTTVEKYQKELSELPAVQQTLNDLGRQQAVLERISELYSSKLTTLKIAGQIRQSSTHEISAPAADPRPSVPNYPLNVGLGMFLGLALGFLWSISTEAKRNPIRSLGQLNRLAIQPCYRVIPELRVPMRGLSRAPAEVFDSLLVNFVRSEKKGYRIGVLGVTKGAGATTTAMNLAVSAARGGYSVLYVEVDPGNNALTKLTPSAGDIKSPGANISIYNASLGETQSGGTIGLHSDLELATHGKDLVIFDFSPVKVSGDSFLLAKELDEMVLLVRANATKSVDFLQAQQALVDAGCPLVSVTLSRVQDQSDDVSALEQQADVRSINPPQA